MTLFLRFLATRDCLPGQKAGQCGEIKIIRMKYSTSASVLLLTAIPQRRETGQCSHFMQTMLTLSDDSMQQVSLREGRVKASQVHAPHTDPTFMLLICAILTGISWHAFVSAILLKPISS
ncbi:hypothetical protein AB184_06145 [Klebsiella oxytoca]|nr:hypothetical protein AB184_06145 [Klebsiella oxytoca]AKL21769.1 hypothetical protein AB181_06400 [Klebsiella oxytoca]APB43345.1 hypothetical protein AGF18_05225 [Klebsiella oxytoca]